MSDVVDGYPAIFRVGVDLGTTHTVVASQKLDSSDAPIELFSIPQLILAGEVAERALLPSMRYHSAEGEFSSYDLQLPWDQGSDDCSIVGEFARKLGSKTQGRLVTSAKSWLSNDSVDRMAPILPWNGSEDVSKISPVEATASYLSHVRSAWNMTHRDALLEHQHVTITIPASFDEIARNLTLEAATQAGLKNVQLLEEPQAASYDWLWQNQQQLEAQLQRAKLLLVCDVGGGTCDFTLIRIDHSTPQSPKLTRIAVGNHLMLGGDNIDLTLAHKLEPHLAGESKLTSTEFTQLVEQCRNAKEVLLSDNAPSETTVTLLGSGRRLIGSSRSTTLTKKLVEHVLLEGFLPIVSLEDTPHIAQSAIKTLGLPYTQDPAITRHIAAFIQTHQSSCKKALEITDHSPAIPDAILLNGGVFNSDIVKQRLIDQLTHWRSTPPISLDNNRPDLAVAYGAVAYSARTEKDAPIIGGGSARSYFLVLDGENNETTEHICLLPQGTEEEIEIHLVNQQFSLTVGKPVSFNLITRIDNHNFIAGQIIPPDEALDQPLPPLYVQLNDGEMEETSEAESIRVELIASLTSIGTLKLQCRSIDNTNRKWNVEFQLRNHSSQQLGQFTLPASFPQAREAINQVYGPKSRELDPKAVKMLRIDLEKLLGPRNDWDSSLARHLFDVLWEGHKYRRRSPNHERVWLSLTGFCIRPGFGFPGDEWRINNLWSLYQSGIQYVNETQVWAEWWTLWRRAAGGLDASQQNRVMKDIQPYLDPAKARQGKNKELAKKHSYDNIVRLAGTLERVPIEIKVKIGDWLAKRLQKASEPSLSWWALGRIGARVPWHGLKNEVVPPEKAKIWLNLLLKQKWDKDAQLAFAAVQLSRVCNDHDYDIDDINRENVLAQLKKCKAPEIWTQMVREFTELDEASEQRIFGEALPTGLRLVKE